MTEQLLQFIWLHRLYAVLPSLKTLDGEVIWVHNPGRLNPDAGPDFLEAKLKIGETLWAGHIELHVRSSDWNRHEHQHDPAYAHLILHVVYEHDGHIQTLGDTVFPTLELKPRIDPGLMLRYEKLMGAKQFIPCAEGLAAVQTITVQHQLSRMLAERFELKMKTINHLLHRFRSHWQEVLYIKLARGFGMQINQDAFEELALCTPLSILMKHRHHPLQLEALLFGQAGFLFDYLDDPYALLLRNEYAYLRELYHLQPMQKHRWKFLRLRPANFPTIRIAQFASLLSTSEYLWTQWPYCKTIDELDAMLCCELSAYWQQHYHFGASVSRGIKAMGKAFRYQLILNVLLPLLYVYGKWQGGDTCCERAIRLVEDLPPEDNAIISKWKQVGIVSKSAADTQALLQLKSYYCQQHRCLSCSIGFSLLR